MLGTIEVDKAYILGNIYDSYSDVNLAESSLTMGQDDVTTKQKPIKILWIYSGEVHKIFMTYSPDFHGQN